MKARTPAEINATAQYEHKGVKINFDIVRARFCADLKGVRLFAPSLDSMKKKIDEHQALKFEAFNAYEFNMEEVESVRVITVRKSNYYNGRLVFATANGREHAAIPLHTPVNKALIKEYQNVWKTNRAKIKQLEAEIDKARVAIPMVKAEDYRVKGAQS